MAAMVGSDRVELNLTPLLDLVLQIIMFFMITVNFVSDQVNANVTLPSSTSAQEIQAKTETDFIVINLLVDRVDRKDAQGRTSRDGYGRPIRDIAQPKTMRIIFAGREDIVFRQGEEGIALGKAAKAISDLARVLRRRQSIREKVAEDQIKELKVPIIIRADVEIQYGLVLPLIVQANREGFSKVELRAQTVQQVQR